MSLKPVRPESTPAPESIDRPEQTAGSVLIAGAEPFHHDAGRVGVLCSHGFTGTPASMLPLATRLAEAGYTVDVPLLPGHGTRWQDLNATVWTDWYAALRQSFDRLVEQCDQVYLAGLSMGGGLCLRIAEDRPADVAGIVLINPAVVMSQRGAGFLPVVSRVVPSLAGIRSDIKKAGEFEAGYDRTPLRAAASLGRLLARVRTDLPAVTQPLLLFRSTIDHVLGDASWRALLAGVGSTDITDVELADSYHVATLDNDGPAVLERTVDWLAERAQAGHSSPGDSRFATAPGGAA